MGSEGTEVCGGLSEVCGVPLRCVGGDCEVSSEGSAWL